MYKENRTYNRNTNIVNRTSRQAASTANASVAPAAAAPLPAPMPSLPPIPVPPFAPTGEVTQLESALSSFSLPELKLPEAATLPSLSLPALPEVDLSSLSLPELKLPETATLPSLSLPELKLPEAATLPSLSLPELKLPEAVTLPSLSLPELKLPEAATLPSLSLPELKLPEAATLPSLSLPELKLPEAATLPSLSLPELKLPEVSLPSFSLDELKFPEIPSLPTVEELLKSATQAPTAPAKQDTSTQSSTLPKAPVVAPQASAPQAPAKGSGGTPTQWMPPQIMPPQIIPPPQVLPQPPIPSPRYAKIRFLNATAHSSLSIAVGTQVVAKSLKRGEVSPYVGVLDGLRTITIIDTATMQPVLRKTLPIKGGEILTMAVIPSAVGVDLLSISDAPCDQGSVGLSCIRMVNLAADSKPLDLLLSDNRVIFADVRYKDVTPFKRIKPGKYKFFVIHTPYQPMPLSEAIESADAASLSVNILPDQCERKVLLSFVSEISASKHYTIYILTGANAQMPLEVLVTEN